MSAPRAAVLSIGDELVLGQTLDRHGAWISDRLLSVGLETVEHRTVADDEHAIAAALRELRDRAALVVATGGLGPTKDDLTREALASATGDRLVEDAAARQAIEAWFASRGRTMPPSNLSQARRPFLASVLANANGTAPGLRVRCGGGWIVCLPGPPREMQPMFEREVLPLAAELATAAPVRTLVVHSFGEGESRLAERIAELMDRDRDPSVGTTASAGGVSARLRTRGGAEAVERLERAAREIESRWAPYVFGRGEATLAMAVGELLVEQGLTLSVAESCTAGMLGEMIVSASGASRYFAGGWQVYSNELKHSLLGVPQEMLAEQGAVSAAVAEVLAREAATRAGTTCALSITGIAGPSGGTPTKPVGTVFVGCFDRRRGGRTRRFLIPGDREVVRDRSARLALMMLRLRLMDLDETPLLWEVRP